MAAATSTVVASPRTEEEEAVGNVVKYAPFASMVDASFWTQLAELKLNMLRLNEDPVPIYGFYNNSSSSDYRLKQQPPRMRVDHSSLLSTTATRNTNEVITCHGTITILNTLETFKTIDKHKLFTNIMAPLLISEEQEEEDLTYLSSFRCLSFLDLKKYTIVYWFLFPALSPSPPTRYFYSSLSSSIRPLWATTSGDNNDRIHQKNISKQHQKNEQFSKAIFEMRTRNNHNSTIGVSYSCPAFFLAINVVDTNNNNDDDDNNKVFCIPLSLRGYKTLSKKDQQNCAFCFVDPSNNEEHPGWPMRNLVSYLSCKFSSDLLPRGTPVHIIAYRPSVMRRIPTTTTMTEDDIHNLCGSTSLDKSLLISIQLQTIHDYSTSTALVGWELNTRYKPGPRIVNLASILDPSVLASQSVDLNLQLMKWRLLPDLNTDMLKNDTKCLLLGAGTLGCNVARTLLGWGVRNLTVVDNGTVSHSNPVRQSLFELTDVGKDKATAAVESLRRIFPQVNARGYTLHIPMPGHAIDEEEGRKTVDTLEHLVRTHNVIFLLTDTRESRWLPTVLAAVHDKLLINAALGLDSWLVIRHGGGISSSNEASCADTTSTASTTTPTPTTDLGCYFCNDVVAPENSTRERTLDQQCTVTRPGLAPIASSIAVELMVALLHTNDKHRTMPPNNNNNTDDDLGIVPHQIRGFLRSYTIMMPTTPRFRCCTACSYAVINEYKSSGFDLVQRVSQDSAYLEDLTGLSEFKKSVDSVQVDWEEYEDDDDDDTF